MPRRLACWLFAIFGTSRQLVVAVSAVIATMSYATVSLIAPPNTSEFIVLTAALAVLAGLISILAGFLKLGRVAQFFSESVMVGFITGLALVIMVKQVPKLLGIEGGEGNFWERLYRNHQAPAGNERAHVNHRAALPGSADCTGALFPQDPGCAGGAGLRHRHFDRRSDWKPAAWR